MLRNGDDLRRIVEIIADNARHNGATLGSAATRAALEQRAVRELYLTGRYLEQHVVDAEDVVRLALDQAATVEQVSGDAADQLDKHGGVGARLRYHVTADSGTSSTQS